MLSRRDLLRRGAALTGSAAAGGLWRSPRATTAGPGATFDHGVASGDPTGDAVVLWTRVGGVVGDVAVRWVLARDEALLDVVRSGEVVTGADRDHTVHVDVDGLGPATTWWYRFDVDGAASPTGTTRTAPAPDDPRQVRLGVVSCSSFAAGPFVAYRHLAAADVDLVVHLGDYLYERGRGPRRHEPEDDPVTLEDYRRRHAQQRSDPDLRRLHATLPMAAVWDDHDVAGNAWRHGAANHDPDLQGPWEARRAAALQAWVEWLPVRLPDPTRQDRIWRRLRLGATVDLLLLDTRHDGRDRQLGSGGPDRADGPRAMVSDDQRRWLAAALAEAGPAWRVLGNQVVLAPLAFTVPDLLAGFADGLGTTVDGGVINPDAWDGYPEAREDLLRAIAAGGPTVVLTGDVHSSWALEVPDRSGTTVAVEWVAPSVSAPPFVDVVGLPGPLAAAALDRLGRQLPHLRWAELSRHGFVVVALDPDRAQADWWHVEQGGGTAEVAASWAVDRAAPTLLEADPLPDRPAPAAAPATPAPTTTAAAGGSDPSDPPVPPVALAGLGALAAGAVGLAIGLRRRRPG